MNNYSIFYTNESLQDLRKLYNYISIDLKSPSIASEQINRIRDKIYSLSMFPNKYKAVEWEPWLSCGMHQMPVNNFLVFYIVDDNTMSVKIVRVFYGKRDIPSLINRS